MEKADIDKFDPNSIRIEKIPFLKSALCMPYRFLGGGGISQKNLHTFFIYELKKYYTKKDHYLFAAKKKDTVVGLCAFYKSEWDSSLFGFGYGTIKYIVSDGNYNRSLSIRFQLIRFVINFAKKNNIRFIHCRSDVTDLANVHGLEKNSFSLISVVGNFVLLSKKIHLLKKRSQNICSAEDSTDIDKIKNVSQFIFTDNRISMDKRFTDDMVQKLYECWIENSCTGIIQDKVFVYKTKDNDIAGFVSCGKKKVPSDHFGNRVGTVDLLGIGKKYQKKGIGVYTLDAACRWLKEHMDITCAVMAVNNTAVIKTAAHFGFTLKSVSADFHWWDDG